MSVKNKPEVQKYRKFIIQGAQSTNGEADARTRVEEDDYDKARRDAELKSFKDDNYSRKVYGYLIFGLVFAWLGVILWIVIAAGSGWYKLSDTVLVALITTTTLNIIGLLLVVTQYLFPKK